MSEGKLRPTQFENYFADADGNIWSTTGWRGQSLRKLTPRPDHYGYLCLRLKTWDRKVKVGVHSLVCYAFNGAKPNKKHEIRHLDGDRKNNSAKNLKWGTSAENAKDRLLHGTTPKGSRNGNSILKEADIPIIRQQISAGIPDEIIGKKFGVKKNAIGMIRRGEKWTHV